MRLNCDKITSAASVIQSRQNKYIAQSGELAVVDFLKKEGFVLVAQNFFTKQGEIDAVLSKGDLIVFVEVKTRSGNLFLRNNIVGPIKQKRIISAAKVFLLQKHISTTEYSIRFDVAIVAFNNNVFQVEHIPNAFYA